MDADAVFANGVGATGRYYDLYELRTRSIRSARSCWATGSGRRGAAGARSGG